MSSHIGCLLVYLPLYSPDLNPIEEYFSALKAYIRCQAGHLCGDEDPIGTLIEACGCITPKKSEGWCQHAGYIW
ncbi:hypothetical protein BS17DRAFT_718571 [Gyrodon lividus]|nr:hypothetical protein BS17DRAFT_718571 [Gyrodon lividus]